jgi:hypothetical protein
MKEKDRDETERHQGESEPWRTRVLTPDSAPRTSLAKIARRFDQPIIDVA